jgi:flagellar biosynthesis/type III secretory pathway protein FliH
MTETARKKYLFDQDFSPRPPSYGTGGEKTYKDKAEELEARFEEGREQGRAQAQASIESETLSALTSIRDMLMATSRSLDSELARIEADSIKMAAVMARVYADALIDRDPAPLIAEAIRQCAEKINNVPTLTITISAQSPKRVRDTIAETIEATGFRGKITIREEVTLLPGDIKLTWPEGGYLRDRSRIDAVIRTMMEIESTEATEWSSSDHRPTQED